MPSTSPESDDPLANLVRLVGSATPSAGAQPGGAGTHHLVCPLCRAAGATIHISPCPPHLTWYVFQCTTCGATRQTPVAAAAQPA